MKRFVLLLCLTGCSEPRPVAPFVGATVTTRDGRTGEIISNYAAGEGTTKWLVKFKEADPKPGQLFTTEAFYDSEFTVQW